MLPKILINDVLSGGVEDRTLNDTSCYQMQKIDNWADGKCSFEKLIQI